MSFSRRSALQAGGLTALGAAAVGIPLGNAVRAKAAGTLSKGDMPPLWSRALPVQSPLAPAYHEARTMPDGRVVQVPHYELVEAASAQTIAPRFSTNMWTYNGSFPGPLISVDRGTPSVVRVRNKMPAQHPLFGYDFATSTHLHGSATLPQYDGYANDLTPPGFYKDYQYPNHQNARTIWYHDHRVHHTANSVYTGLAAGYVIHDPIERAMLPQGDYDIPLIVSDCILDAQGQLMHLDNSHSGLWGDIVLVNGVPWPYLNVEPRVYRFRVLVASIGRSFRFTLSNGAPVWVVGTDGGLVPTAQRVTSWRHGMAERYEVLVDFSGLAGQTVELRNLSNNNNVDYDRTGKVLQFRVGTQVTSTANNTIPTVLYPEHETMALRRSDATKKRYFRLHKELEVWKINGETWEDVVGSNFRHVQADPGLGDVEIWTIENKGGGWFHPSHIHLVDFQILSRNGRPPFAYERGPKDVVYVGEGEKVDLLMRFGPHRGRYMLHCHNVSHEDSDMMTQFSVGLDRNWTYDPNDPVGADPARWDDLGS